LYIKTAAFSAVGLATRWAV